MVKKCKWCGKEFNAVPAQRKYCSDKCRSERLKEAKKGYDKKWNSQPENQEWKRKYGHNYRQAHKEEMRKYRKRYYQEHREYYLNYKKEYYRKYEWPYKKRHYKQGKVKDCMKRHGGCFECPYEDCIR